MDPLTIYELVAIAGVIIGTYVKLKTDITRLEAKVESNLNKIKDLERDNSNVSKMLQKLHEDLNEIKLLLARNQLDK